MTYDNVDLRKAKPVSLFKARKRRRLHDLCLCVPGLSFFPFDYILVKTKVISTSGNLAE